MLSVESKWTVCFSREVILDSKHSRPLLLQRRRHRLTEEDLPKALGSRREGPSGRKPQQACISYFKGNCTDPSCFFFFGILTYVKITYLNRDANSATNVFSDILRLTGSPVKSRRKVVGKDQLPCWRSQYSLVACPKRQRRAIEEVYSTEELKIGIKLHHQLLQGHMAPHTNRERKGPSQGVIQKCEPQERNPCAPKFEDTGGNLATRTMRSQRTMKFHEKANKLKIKDKATFFSPAEAWVMPPPSSKKPEVREFMVDFQSIDAHAEPKRFKLSRIGNPSKVQEHHNGDFFQVGSAYKWGSTSEFSRPWALRDGANPRWHACSLVIGVFCEEHGCTNEWASGQKQHLTKNGKTILCKKEKFVPIVLPGLSSSSSASSSSTSEPQDTSGMSPARLRSDDTHAQASGNRGDPTKTKIKN